MEIKCNVRKIAELGIAVTAIAAVLVAGCGGGGALGLGSGGGGTTFSGFIANSPLDGAPIKATCKDGTAGGTAVTSKGTYSISVTCAQGNFPIVISVDSTKIDDGTYRPTMAGPDMQFGTADDETYKTTERAPLKVAIESISSVTANMNAVTTLAAQPIEDKINHVGGASAPTAADVQVSETSTQQALGLASVKNSDTVRDPQVARVSAQILEAVAVTKALGASAVKPEDVMKLFAQAAANTTNSGNTLIDTNSSFDITKTQTALAALPAASAAASAVTAVNTAMNDAKSVESAIKAKGTEMEQVAKAVASISGVGSATNLTSIASDIKTAISASSAVSRATVTAKVSGEAIKQAVVKAQEINVSTTITESEKTNRKKAVFAAAETVRATTENEILSASSVGLTATQVEDQNAKTIAKVSMAVNMAANQLKTLPIGDIVSASGVVKASVAGMVGKMVADIGDQIKNQTAVSLGDLKNIDPATMLGKVSSTAYSGVDSNAATVVNMLSNFTPPPGVGEAATRIAVNAVIASMGNTAADLAGAASGAIKTNIQSTITNIANQLNAASSTVVTVNNTTGTLSNLPDDEEIKMLASIAKTMIGSSQLDFSAPPTVGSAASAVAAATTVVNSTVIATLDTPTLTPVSLSSNNSVVSNTESCSADVTVSGDINVAIPIKLTATDNGSPAAISAGDAFAPPPAAGSTAQPTSGLKAFVKVNGGTTTGGFLVFPNAAGLLVGTLNKGNRFALCVLPTAPAHTYVLTAQAGSRYVFSNDTFAVPANVKTISFTTVTAKANQSITFGTAPSVAMNGTGTVSATASSNLAVVFSSTTPSTCSVSGSTVTGIASGVCTIAADQAGNTTYNAAPQVTQTINVGAAAQSIAFGTAPTMTFGGGTGSVSATATSGLAVTYTSTTPTSCTISGTTVTSLAAGACIIAANQAGNTNYSSAAQVTQNIAIAKGSQTVSFGAAPSVVVGGTGTASATATSGLAVAYTSTTTGVCTVSGSTVTGVTAGTCTIAAGQAGNANYNAATQATQNITVGKGNQTISFGAAPSVAVNGTGTVSATASSSLAVTYTSTTTGVCTVSGSTVTGVTAGTCTIAANQAGNADYNAATQATQNITVGALAQTITFGTAPAVTVGGTGTVSATGGASGNAVTFSSTTTGVCTISGTTVTGVAAGTCTIAANQAGNTTYNAAAQVTQNITVSAAASPALNLGATTTVVDTLRKVGVNVPGTTSSCVANCGLGVNYTGAPVAFGPYTVTGLSAPASVTMFTPFSTTYQTMKVNSGMASSAPQTVANGDTITLYVDLATYVIDNAAPLGYGAYYFPRIKVGTTATITFGSSMSVSGIQLCTDPTGPPTTNFSPCL